MFRIGTAVLAALLVAPILSAQEADLEVGTWDVTYSSGGQQSAVMLSVARNSNGKLVGLWSEGEDWISMSSVQFDNGKLVLQKPVIVDGDRVNQAVEVTLDEQSLSGTWKTAAGSIALRGTKRVKYQQAPRRGRRGGGRENFDIGALIEQADANGDGKLQKDEAPGQLKQFFDMMDADKDGSVTKEEAEEAFKRFQGSRN